MKRSTKVVLVLMASGLAGCEEPVYPVVSENVGQCAAYYNKEKCLKDFADATALHKQVAPRYTKPEDCAEDFGAGNCEATAGSSGGFVYMPYMSGYMSSATNPSNTSSFVQSQPLYRSKDDPSGFRTATNELVSNKTGHTKVYPSSVPVSPAGIVNRGGFGATAYKHSGGSYGG